MAQLLRGSVYGKHSSWCKGHKMIQHLGSVSQVLWTGDFSSHRTEQNHKQSAFTNAGGDIWQGVTADRDLWRLRCQIKSDYILSSGVREAESLLNTIQKIHRMASGMLDVRSDIRLIRMDHKGSEKSLGEFGF